MAIVPKRANVHTLSQPAALTTAKPGPFTVLSNLFHELPPTPPAEEQLQTLLLRPGLKIERIVSFGHASPADFWYQQEQDEWVLLLSGSAQLRFADESEPRTLAPGDFVEIAAQRRHRVDATAADQPTVWLALFYPATA